MLIRIEHRYRPPKTEPDPHPPRSFLALTILIDCFYVKHLHNAKGRPKPSFSSSVRARLFRSADTANRGTAVGALALRDRLTVLRQALNGILHLFLGRDFTQ